ncbi:hypothetical protein [Cellulomonas endophytica]|uniref:hypothetical protein n=1 Tax=Cellulomonas endophytica TaxID=2494735 RepID=UPI00101017B7|nr:hypothetical protein [Cellulomonas endophytica]
MGRRVLAVLAGVALAAALGGVAALLRDEDRLLVFAVFTASTLAPAVATALLLLVWIPQRTELAPVERPDDVERVWWLAASSGAFLDLMALLGLGLVVVSVTDVGAAEPSVVLLAVLLLGWADVAVRWTRQRRLEAA